MNSLAEMQFKSAWEASPLDGADFTEQHQFHPTRRWRFDFAFPSMKLAIEIDGAGPGHLSIWGQRRDSEKLNAALALGWRVMRFPASEKHLAGDWVRQVKEVLCVTLACANPTE